jgi:hypothetical protein
VKDKSVQLYKPVKDKLIRKHRYKKFADNSMSAENDNFYGESLSAERHVTIKKTKKIT